MSAEVIGQAMPARVGLDDLAAMNTADLHGHRYETSPEGMLSVMPPPDSDHAGIASDLFAWFIVAGWLPRQILQAAGIRISGPDGEGGYEVGSKMPLAWLLRTEPAEHLG